MIIKHIIHMGKHRANKSAAKNNEVSERNERFARRLQNKHGNSVNVLQSAQADFVICCRGFNRPGENGMEMLFDA